MGVVPVNPVSQIQTVAKTHKAVQKQKQYRVFLLYLKVAEEKHKSYVC